MRPNPDVTVIIPAWCAAGMLAACTASALAQAGVTVEVLIVDDASPDDTFTEAKRLAADPRVRAVRQTVNGGPSAARNRGLEAARGTWVAMLDVDDAMAPQRLRRMIDLAKARGADVVLGNLREVDEAGAPLAQEPFLTSPDAPTRWDIETFVAGNLAAAGGKSFGYLKPLLRRDFVAAHTIRYDPSLRNGEDFHLILSCYRAGGAIWFAPDADYLYTRRTGSISHRAVPEHMAALIAADRAFAARIGGSAELQRLFRIRHRQLADIRTAEIVLGAIKGRQPLEAGRAFLQRPQAGGRILRQLAEAVRKRVQPVP